MLDALHELADVSEALCVHAPTPAEGRRLRLQAARVHEAMTGFTEHAEVLTRVDALVAHLGEEHDPARWKSLRAALVEGYQAQRRVWEAAAGSGRPVRIRSKPHNVARTTFHVLSGVMWALVYEHVLDRGPLLWVIGACLVFFLTDDAMRRWFPDRRSGFAVVVFRVLARASEASGIATSTWYALGLMVGVAFLPKPACLMGLLILAFADPAAGLVGRRWGGPRIYRDKSLGGSTAFFVVAFGIAGAGLAIELPALALGARLGTAAVIAAVGTVAELLGDHVADNFSILVVTGAMAAFLM